MSQLTTAATLIGQSITDILRADANADGKVSTQEVFALVVPLGMRVFTTVNTLDVPTLVSQLRTADSDARKAALDAIDASFDLKDDELEELIQDVLDVLDELYADVRKQTSAIQGIVERVKARQ